MAIKITLKGLTLACVLFTNTVFAQDAAKADAPVPLSIAGHVDAYYRYSTNGVADGRYDAICDHASLIAAKTGPPAA